MDDAITTADVKAGQARGWAEPGPAPVAKPSPPADPGWRGILGHLRGETRRCTGPYAGIFEPLLKSAPDGLMVVGQLGQSLDGRIATVTGHSKWINGDHGLKHLHRLRAVVEAVMVGIGTAAFDDPMLNTRLVEGDDPARIVIDPRGRLDPKAKLLREDGRRRIVVTGTAPRDDLPRGVEQVRLPLLECGSMQPVEILRALKALGFSRVLLEGGAHTVSRFLDAGCLDGST